jgi:predicted porin
MTFTHSWSMRAALLGGVAFALSASVTARADDVSDLKAQIQSLNKRLDEMQVEAKKKEKAKAQTQAPVPAQGIAKAPPLPDVPLALRTDNSGNLIKFPTSPVMLYDDKTTSLHMYGIIEATLSGWSNQPDASGNGKPTWAYGFQTSWFSGNRLGFDIDHALGDKFGPADLKLIAKLETEFETPTGNSDTPGVLFNRDAWVGFQSSSLGKLTFGRQNTVTRDFTQTWGDPYGTPDVTLKEGGYSNVNNFKQIIFYSAASTLTRNDSAIVWKKTFLDDHVVIGLDYAFGSQGVGGSGNGGIGNTPLLDGGGGSPGHFEVGSNQAISLAYNNFEIGNGKLSVNVNYNRANCGNFGDNHCSASDPSAGNLVNSNTNQAFLTGGTYVWGNGFRIGAGYIHYVAQQNTSLGNLGDRVDNVWIVDGTIPLSKGARDIDFYWGVWEAHGHNAALYAGGNLVVLPFFISTANSTTTADGSRTNATASVMYHVDKQTDIYLAFDWQQGHGGWAHALFNDQGNGDAAQMGSTSLGIGTGFRYKF